MKRLAYGFAVAVVMLALVLPFAPAALGVRLLVVDGGSMAPTYQVGDVVAVAPIDGVPDVGTVVVVEQDGERYAHRVVQIDDDRLRLRGDANEVTDPGWVEVGELAGTVTRHLGGPAALAVVAATSLEGRIALVLLLTVLVATPFARRLAAPAPLPDTHEVPTP
ncbi:S24 family peptidase [Microbacterium sp. NPDC089189]|uniref:S24 family peptidase n=1 Tax=Microbacterium sp. NPDC089189 TaxID=3154972 RepID=UPI003429E7DF